ncbi:MAG: type I methionyl aminopeptidase [Candidatus Omnitrophica bacterium]|nr:type I methionyl aminopeptidase [Candidatus Omnitrophota bacterium]
MVIIKTAEEIQAMKKAGMALARVINGLTKAVKPGVTTKELDNLALELMSAEHVLPAFKGYHGFPANTCTSLNSEVVHGIPGERVLKEGDILSLDVGVNLDGFFSDSAVTVAVGKIDARAKKLIQVTKEALYLGIKQARAHNCLFDISHAIQEHVESNKFSVVRQFVGHGIGRNLHEEPEIPNFGRPHQGIKLVPGMVLAIEPMVNMGTWQTKIDANNWTALTNDGSLSAHFEHTVLITSGEPGILTQI